MAYPWSAHIKSMCALLRADGSGWTKQLYAEDRGGRRLELGDDARAVKWSLLGVHAKILNREYPLSLARMPPEQWQAVLHKHLRRTDIFMHLLYRAGLPKLDSKSAETSALLKFEQTADWSAVKKLLSRAYKIAQETDAQPRP